MLRSNWAREPQLLSLRSRARAPGACALQQERPLQGEARAPQQGVATRSPQLERARVQQRRPNTAKNK